MQMKTQQVQHRENSGGGAAMLIAVLIAPHLGIDKGGLNYIQEYTGFVSPGIFAMFYARFLLEKNEQQCCALLPPLGGFAVFSVVEIFTELDRCIFSCFYRFCKSKRQRSF
jgi:hypothetical protein